MALLATIMLSLYSRRMYRALQSSAKGLFPAIKRAQSAATTIPMR